MDAAEHRRLVRTMRRLNAERRAVIDHLQSRSRQLELTARMLRRQLNAAGLEPNEVTIYEQIEPLNNVPNLHSTEETARQVFHQIPQTSARAVTDERPWWPSFDDNPKPIKPNPGWQNIKLLDKAVRTVGIMLLGQTPAGIDRVVEMFQRQQTQRQDFTPIFIIDCDYTDPFLQAGFIFEMIQPPEEQALYSGTRPWNEFVMDRLVGIREKWFVVQFLEFGKTRYKIEGMAQLQAGASEDGEEPSTGTTQDNEPFQPLPSFQRHPAE